MTGQTPPRWIHAGVDVGGTKTEVALLNERGTVLSTARVGTQPGPEGVVASIVASISAARLAGSLTSPLRSVGIGVPGAVDPASGVVGSAVNIALHDFALGREAARVLGVPVHIDNDVTLAALGLAREEGESTSLALVSLGTGFGVGVVIGGIPLRGSRGAAGEIGHLPFDPHGARCACGLKGCVEMSASGAALARAAGLRTVPQLFADATSGDEPSARAVEKFCRALALGLRAVVQAYDVDTVALGGGVFASSMAFMPRVREILSEEARSSFFVRGLRIEERIREADHTSPYAAIGAANSAMRVYSDAR